MDSLLSDAEKQGFHYEVPACLFSRLFHHIAYLQQADDQGIACEHEFDEFFPFQG